MASLWKEPEVEGVEDCPAARMWHSACSTLNAPDAADAWRQVVEASPADDMWHSLRNCIAYQAGVWQRLLSQGIPDVMQPAAFKLALVLRHTPTDLAVKLLGDLLKQHPQNQDLTSYIAALLTESELSSLSPLSPCASPAGPAPRRDLQLFSDCELCVLAADRTKYDDHVERVRAEYGGMDGGTYVGLRLKILNQLSKIPKLFHTPEFEPLEATAKENIQREISNLKENGGNASKA